VFDTHWVALKAFAVYYVHGLVDGDFFVFVVQKDYTWTYGLQGCQASLFAKIIVLYHIANHNYLSCHYF
jgi:hypothetical protein